uniref:Uncharacterized protein n=1 Tax=Globodera rostochiensis TaxID=31243 RepID=A0A914H3W1_GLORO
MAFTKNRDGRVLASAQPLAADKTVVAEPPCEQSVGKIGPAVAAGLGPGLVEAETEAGQSVSAEQRSAGAEAYSVQTTVAGLETGLAEADAGTSAAVEIEGLAVGISLARSGVRALAPSAGRAIAQEGEKAMAGGKAMATAGGMAMGPAVGRAMGPEEVALASKPVGLLSLSGNAHQMIDGGLSIAHV